MFSLALVTAVVCSVRNKVAKPFLITENYLVTIESVLLLKFSSESRHFGTKKVLAVSWMWSTSLSDFGGNSGECLWPFISCRRWLTKHQISEHIRRVLSPVVEVDLLPGGEVIHQRAWTHRQDVMNSLCVSGTIHWKTLNGADEDNNKSNKKKMAFSLIHALLRNCYVLINCHQSVIIASELNYSNNELFWK